MHDHAMKKSLLLLTLGVAVLSFVACGGSATGDEGAEATEATSGSELALVPPGEASVGDRTTCPISGEEFVVTDSSPSVEHEGRTYFFCCPNCAERFAADPEKYVGGAEESETETE